MKSEYEIKNEQMSIKQKALLQVHQRLGNLDIFQDRLGKEPDLSRLLLPLL